MQQNQNSFADAVAIASPAVVTIRAISIVETEVPEGVQLLERFLGKNSTRRPETRTESTSGSGVIMDAEGFIITNHHVVADADRLAVLLTDGRSGYAELVGIDPETDLAVIKIDLERLPVIQPSSMTGLRIGDIALAIGYPYAIGQTVTQGIISATGRNRISSAPYQNYIQTDAAINPGNSGGALVNSNGELIGINTLVSSNFSGISFAIPVDMATDVYRQIKDRGYVVRGWLGLEGQPLTPGMIKRLELDTPAGILITGVDENGPGAKAGLQEGDIITHIDKLAIVDISDIMQKVADGVPGDTLKLSGLRQRESFMAEVTLGQRPLQSQ